MQEKKWMVVGARLWSTKNGEDRSNHILQL